MARHCAGRAPLRPAAGDGSGTTAVEEEERWIAPRPSPPRPTTGDGGGTAAVAEEERRTAPRPTPPCLAPQPAIAAVVEEER